MPPGVISTSTKHPIDPDDASRSTKRRKPTDPSIPTRFTPTVPDRVEPGPTDRKLAASLAALDHLSESYSALEELEHKLDWTLSRKHVEVTENHAGTRAHDVVQVPLRVHVEAVVRDQAYLLTPGELEQAGEIEHGDGPPPAETKVPRVEVKISGEILDNETFASSPFTAHFSRVTVESTSLPTSVSWTRPPPTASSSSPTSTTESKPNPTFPRVLNVSVPTSSTTALRILLHPHHPPGYERYALLPELAQLLDCAESDRIGVLERLWTYVREKGLILEPESSAANPTAGRAPGGGGPQQPQRTPAGHLAGGIKTDARLRKFFQNQAVVPFHHLPEYVNRWLAPISPRVIEVEVPIGAEQPLSLHTAYDVPLFLPSPHSASVRSIAQTFLSSFAPSTPLVHEVEALSDQIANSALSVSTHLANLHALVGFTRDPVQFLRTYLSSQASSLETVLSKSGRGDSSGLLGSGAMGVGTGWKEDMRASEKWDGEWVKEAVAVWDGRETEARIRAKTGGGAAVGAGGHAGRR
ncbi:hypothetical protein JCM10212_000330 [Sporobolomyces blumeae]